VLNIGLDLLEQVGDIAKKAGQEILKVYETNFDVEKKSDSTPVTEADKRSEEIILRSISMGVTDKFPIISEEAFAINDSPEIGNGPFWLVDPLDGTKEFINRNGEFTVNIALIESERPVLGVIHSPVSNQTYWGAAVGSFSKIDNEEEKIISCRIASKNGLEAIVSRSHRLPEEDKLLSDYKIISETSAGSSLKFCRIAEGKADIYPRLGRTMEWDTAAGHAILHFAGGTITKLDGSPLLYAKSGFENPAFLALGTGVEKNK
jgi:3'(2'), 5'-bisphosphate nucleotidase